RSTYYDLAAQHLAHTRRRSIQGRRDAGSGNRDKKKRDSQPGNSRIQAQAEREGIRTDHRYRNIDIGMAGNIRSYAISAECTGEANCRALHKKFADQAASLRSKGKLDRSFLPSAYRKSQK